MARKTQVKLSKKQNTSTKNQMKPSKSKTESSKETFTGQLPYTLTNDFFFKAFFQRNENALRGLLSALLSIKPEEITSIVITNPIHEGDTVDDKNTILDIKLILNNTQIINLEMQVANLGNWPERSLTYLCRMFDQLKSGEDYELIKKTIHIGIMDFTPKDFPKTLYSEYYLYNLKTGHKYSDKFGIHMLQLKQLGNPDDEKNMPDLYYWAQLFKAQTWEAIQMLAEKNEFIKQGIVTLQELTADEKAKMQMEARERYRRDLAASLALGKQESEEAIHSLENTIQEQQGTIDEQQSTIDEQQSTIDEQQSTIDEQQNVIQQSQAENVKLQAEMDKIQEEKAKMEARIRFLEIQMSKENE